MQNLSSKQSTVRTDFTLSYYLFEEQLEKSNCLMFEGADSFVFLRSWAHYSQAKSLKVVIWSSGDLAVLYQILSDELRADITSEEQLLQVLSELNNETITVLIDAVDVELSHIKKLHTVLGSLNSSTYDFVIYQSSDLNNSHRIAATFGDAFPVFSLGNKCSLAKVDQTAPSKAKIFVILSGCLCLFGALLFWYQPVLLQTLMPSEDVTFVKNNESDGAKDKKLASLPASRISLAETNNQPIVDSSQVPLPIVEKGVVTIVEETQPLPSSQIDSQSEVKDIGDTVVAQLVGEKADSTAALPKTDTVATGSVKPESDTVPTVIQEPIPLEQTNLSLSSGSENAVKQEPEHIQSNLQVKSNIEQTINHNTITLFVDDWIQAWQQQDFLAYQQYYRIDYRSDKFKSHTAWAEYRQSRIEKPKWIRLSQSGLTYRSAAEDKHYSVSFNLNYRAPAYADVTEKKLTIRQVGNSFEIISEENLAVIKR